MNDFLGLLHHLAFRDPQGGLGHSNSKVVNLNTVELADRYLNRIESSAVAKGDLAAMEQEEYLVFQPPQRNIGLCQEVA